MLRNSFLHIPGIGLKTEQNIWSGGILSWDDLLKGGSARIPSRKRDIITRCIEDSLEHLSKGNPNYFGSLLPTSQFWRFFPEFRESTVYLDIETTGDDIQKYKIIVTYNGRCFDVPFLESYFGIKLH